jgi:hypothetical protein
VGAPESLQSDWFGGYGVEEVTRDGWCDERHRTRPVGCIRGMAIQQQLRLGTRRYADGVDE